MNDTGSDHEADKSLLVICAHGSAKHPAANDHVLALASRLKADGPFDNICVVFHACDPKSPDLKGLRVADYSEIVLVPYMMSDGFLANQMITKVRKDLQNAGFPADIIVNTRAAGTHPSIADLCLDMGKWTVGQAGLANADVEMVVVAHGSRNAPESRLAATAHYESVTNSQTFKKTHLAFIEEPPFLSDTLKIANRPAVIVGLFAAPGGHAIDDISEAIEAAGKDHFLNAGPVGLHPDIGDIIIRRAEESIRQ